MDAVIAPGGRPTEGADRIRAFRATDHFALALWQELRSFTRAEGETLAGELRRAVARTGGALAAAASAADGAPGRDREALASAHAGLLEIRYYLYLARRLGCLDIKRYRHLAALQDAAMREIEPLIA
jgi:hypothetical protein